MKLLVSMNAAARPALAAVIFTAFLLLQAGCSKVEGAADASNSATNAPAETTVTLSGDQLNAIKIGTVGTDTFTVEKEEVGSVSFDEDPATVQAEATLLAAAGTAEVSSNELVRARALSGKNGISQREMEQAIADDETAESALKAARDAVRALGESNDDIDQMLAVGRIEAGQGIHRVPKWVEANVVEADTPAIQEGQPVKVKVTAFPDTVFDGTVSKIYSTVDPNTHCMEVRCGVDDPKDVLRVGMLATVVIEIAKPVEGTAIPANGVVREGDGTMTTWTTTDRQHFTQQVIKVGLQNGGMDQVVDGLQPGEGVVTDGAIFLDNMVNAVPDD